jgi:peptidoglycan/LPS O-acetylase OafA/YrhL
MFGILFCEYRKPIMDLVTRPLVLAALAGLILSIASVQAMVMHFPGNLERMPGDGWGFVGFDAMLVQKYAGIVFLCGLLTHVAGWMKRPLTFVSDHSFGLFFIHGIVIAVLMRLPQPLSPHVGEPVIDLAIYSAFVIAISLAVVVTAKYLTGKYSRYVIGC